MRFHTLPRAAVTTSNDASSSHAVRDGRIAERIAELIDCGRDFHQRGWMLATAGNLSVRTGRDPLRYAITASGGDKGRLTHDDFVELGLGRTAPSSPRRTSAETGVHDRLYATRAPGAILHVHGPAMTLVSRALLAEGALVLEGWEYVKALGFWDRDAVVRVPIVPNHHDLDALADAVADAATDVPVVLVAGHGAYAWGDTVFDARRHVEATEFLCSLAWEWRRAGFAG